MKKKVIKIIAVVIIIMILGIIGIINNNQGSKEENISGWEELYLDVLTNEKNFTEIEDTKIQLCDLNKDNIPELIIYEIDKTEKYIVNIYNINKDNKIYTTNISSENKIDFKLLFNLEQKEYRWYVCTPINEKISLYTLNCEDKEYKAEIIDKDYYDNFIEVKSEYSLIIDFDTTANKSEKKKILEKAKENYKNVDEILTEEVRQEVEIEKTVKTLKKVNPDKEIVYTAKSIETNGCKYEYPTINLSSNDIDNINLEIKNKYGFYNLNDILNNSYGKCEEIGYKYFINKKYLSLLIYTGGNESLWAEVYNIDLENLAKIENVKILDEYNFDKDKIADKAFEAAIKKFEETRLKEKDLWTINALIDSEYEKWKLELEDDLRKLERIYIDDNGDVCLLTEFKHIGGTYSCTKTIIINISKDYKVSEFDYAKIISSPKPRTSQLVPNNQTSNIPTTPNAITTDEAIKLAQQVFGTSSSETGYEIGYSYYCWVKDSLGKEYYLIDMRWFNGTNWSWIGTVCIAVDGKSYKQLDMPPTNYQDGDTITNMIEGEAF